MACQHGWYAGDQGPVNSLYSLTENFAKRALWFCSSVEDSVTLNRAEAQRSLVLHDLDMDIVMPMERSRPVLPGTKPYRRSRAISSPASRRQDVPVLPPGGRDAPARTAASVRCRGGAALAKALVDRTHSGGHIIRESRRSVSPSNPRASQSDLLAVLSPSGRFVAPSPAQRARWSCRHWRRLSTGRWLPRPDRGRPHSTRPSRRRSLWRTIPRH